MDTRTDTVSADDRSPQQRAFDDADRALTAAQRAHDDARADRDRALAAFDDAASSLRVANDAWVHALRTLRDA